MVRITNTVNSKVEIDYLNHRGERGVRIITPMQLSFGTNQFHGDTLQWLLRANDSLKGNRVFAMKDVRRWGAWDEAAERKLFEDSCYEQYLAKRASREAQGIISPTDTVEVRSKAETFVRDRHGDYIAIVYQAAWFGWKMARGA